MRRGDDYKRELRALERASKKPPPPLYSERLAELALPLPVPSPTQVQYVAAKALYAQIPLKRVTKPLSAYELGYGKIVRSSAEGVAGIEVPTRTGDGFTWKPAEDIAEQDIERLIHLERVRNERC